MTDGPVFGEAMGAFLESGCGLIVGTVGADGAPHAGRGWGLDVVDGDAGRIRLLLDAADGRTLANLAGDPRIAITGADIPTLHSRQLKGVMIGTHPATGEDRARAARYCDALFTVIEQTDGEPRVLLEQLRPAAYVACTVEVDAVFDQTPGPAAGSAVAVGSG